MTDQLIDDRTILPGGDSTWDEAEEFATQLRTAWADLFGNGPYFRPIWDADRVRRELQLVWQDGPSEDTVIAAITGASRRGDTSALNVEHRPDLVIWLKRRLTILGVVLAHEQRLDADEQGMKAHVSLHHVDPMRAQMWVQLLSTQVSDPHFGSFDMLTAFAQEHSPRVDALVTAAS